MSKRKLAFLKFVIAFDAVLFALCIVGVFVFQDLHFLLDAGLFVLIAVAPVGLLIRALKVAPPVE
jgi:hypothetical protein